MIEELFYEFETIKRRLEVDDRLVLACEKEAEKIVSSKEYNSKNALEYWRDLVNRILGKGLSIKELLAIAMAKELAQLAHFEDDKVDSVIDFIGYSKLYVKQYSLLPL